MKKEIKEELKLEIKKDEQKKPVPKQSKRRYCIGVCE